MRARALVLAACAALVGCSALLGVESDRHVAADAGAPGGPLPPHFECIDQPQPAVPAAVRLQLTIGDVSSASSVNDFVGNPVAGVDLRACAALDLDCAQPLTKQTTSDAGTAHFDLPGGFDGYYEGRAAGDAGYAPAIYKRTPQILNEAASEALTKYSLLAAGGGLAFVHVDTTLGIAILIAQDCDSNPAEGIVFDVEGATADEALVYLANSLPSATATQTDTSAGSAVLFNVPPGTLTVTARFAANGGVLRRVSTVTRAGWISFVQFRLDQSTSTLLP